MEQPSLFDLLGDEFKRKESNDWRWYMSKDYPKSNGLKVFSCFACGGGRRWATNLRAAKF